jgi:hypothetical protein
MTLTEKALSRKPYTALEKKVILSLLNNGYLDPISTADKIRKEIEIMADMGKNLSEVSDYLDSYDLECDLHYYFISDIEINIF